MHQFSKVEMFVGCSPAQGEALHAELLDIEVEMFRELGLHFRVRRRRRVGVGLGASRGAWWG